MSRLRKVRLGGVDGPALVRLEVYLGGASKSGQPLEATCFRNWVRRVADRLEAAGGGATVHALSEGRWGNHSEPSVRVEAFLTPTQVDRVLYPGDVFANFLASTHQDAVLVVVDGEPWLLETNPTGER